MTVSIDVGKLKKVCFIFFSKKVNILIMIRFVHGGAQ